MPLVLGCSCVGRSSGASTLQLRQGIPHLPGCARSWGQHPLPPVLRHCPGCPVAVRAQGRSGWGMTRGPALRTGGRNGSGVFDFPEQHPLPSWGCAQSWQGHVLTACLAKAMAVLFIPIHSPFNPLSVLATCRIGFEAEQGTGDFSLLDTTTTFPPRTAHFS